jgi:hypothetical protein
MCDLYHVMLGYGQFSLWHFRIACPYYFFLHDGFPSDGTWCSLLFMSLYSDYPNSLDDPKC